MKQTKDWEKEFDELFDKITLYDEDSELYYPADYTEKLIDEETGKLYFKSIRPSIKDFIQNLLTQQKKEIVEIIEKKKTESEKFVPFQKIHYQSALEDIKNLLTKE